MSDKFPKVCQSHCCGMRMDNEAEAFLHAALHADPDDIPWTLHALPYGMFPRVARLMIAFRDADREDWNRSVGVTHPPGSPPLSPADFRLMRALFKADPSREEGP